MEKLLAKKYKKQKLRAHSDFMWNTAVNDWALTFLDTADIMVESKCKNLASQKLYEYANTRKNNNIQTQFRPMDIQQSQNTTDTTAIIVA